MHKDNIQDITGEHLLSVFSELSELWHKNNVVEVVTRADSFTSFTETLHRYNYLLWHEEDEARRTDVNDSVIAKVKRNIDKYNQKRNDTIEKIDTLLIQQLEKSNIQANENAVLNSETPGNIIDRLSILSLKIYHMEEQARRSDVAAEHIQRAISRMVILKEQQSDLSECLIILLNDIFAGRKRIKVYHQFKLYNDPTTNPAVYQSMK